MKWSSRKLWLTVAVMSAAVVLLCAGKLSEVYFCSLFGGAYIIYLYTNGKINLENVRLKAGNVEVGGD